MRVERALVGVVVVLGGSLGAVAGGCVSSSNPPGATGEDASFPTSDGAAPPFTQDGSPTPVKDSQTPEDAPSVVTPDDGGPPPDAAALPGLVRFAWFVGGVAPPSNQGERRVPFVTGGTFDVCVAPHGTGQWTGPLLTQADASTSGLAPFDVTVYFPVVAGRYDARIVEAGSGTCNPQVVDAGREDAGAEDAATGDAAVADAGVAASPYDFTSLPAIVAGKAVTFVLVDPAATSTTVADVVVLQDDTTTSAGKAKLRFANVSGLDAPIPLDGGSVTDDAGGTIALDGGTAFVGGDFGIGGGVVLSNLFTNVTTAATVASVANGYVEVPPISGIDSTATLPSSAITSGPPSFDSDSLSTDGLELPAGTMLTAFLASEASSAGGGTGGSSSGGAQGRPLIADPAGRSPVLVWCYDGQTSATNSLLTKCAYNDVSGADSAVSGVRFGNFVADTAVDAGAEDICLKAHGYGEYVGPLVANGQVALGQTVTSIPQDQLSAYFNVHGGFEYDARFVAAGATSCATSDGDSTFTAYTGSGGGYTSVLLTGYRTIPDDAGAVPPYDAGAPNDAGPDSGAPVSTGLTSIAKAIVAIQDVPYNDANSTASLRLVHMDAQQPDPLTVLATGTDSNWEIDNVPYGGFSTQPQTDPYGYVPMASGSLTLSSSAFPKGTWTYDLPDDENSIFAYNTPTGMQFIACNDYDEVQYPDPEGTLYYTCCVVTADGTTCGSGGGSGSSSSGGDVRSRLPTTHKFRGAFDMRRRTR